MIVKYSNVFNLTSICSRVEENPLDVRSSILRSEIFIPVYGAGMERKNKFPRRIGAGWGRKQKMYSGMGEEDGIHLHRTFLTLGQFQSSRF